MARDRDIPAQSSPAGDSVAGTVQAADSQGNEELSTVETTDATSPQNAELMPPITLPQVDLLTRIKRGFVLPALYSEHVSQYEKWNSEHPTFLKDLFARSEPFLHYIVEQLEKRNLPMELALLPAIESAFKPHAVSRSGAAGLWQFIPATGRHYGLHQDWWYDGRLDVVASTNAALDYLTELNNRFNGDWFLTLAAYNAGQGTIARAIKANHRANRGSSYAELTLRSETERYVPKLMALKNIISNPHEFGVSLPQINNQPHFEILPLDRQIDLRRFAAQSGIDHKRLQNMNAGFIRWATSPYGSHNLLVPVSHLTEATQVMQAISQTPAVSYKNHIVRAGDTLGGISHQYGVSVAALQKTNKLPDSKIVAGRSLYIPVSADADSYSAPTLSDSVNNDNKLFHRVKRGDTLWSIARHYKVKLQQLLTWNGISADQILSLDQTLLVITN
ncbi:MAG: transglycosylase SLT domain-containing protein [Arenicella sp.]|nr:transglycosylase SLT domain-containing protein [Arenicella sp.]